jgi:hypothetical protein
MSDRQVKTAVRVANVPTETFNGAVESDTPPTVAKLAEMGTKGTKAPAGFKEATKLLGGVRRFHEFGQYEAMSRTTQEHADELRRFKEWRHQNGAMTA